MSAAPQIDLDSLAAQHGGRTAGLDLDALASQHGGRPAGPTNPDAGFHPLDSAAHAVHEWWDQVNPVAGIEGVGHALAHPAGTAQDWGAQNVDLFQRAKQAYDQGDYSGAAAHILNYALNGIPGLGTLFDKAGQKFQSGDISGGVGQTLGVATNLLAPEIAGRAAALTTRAASPVVSEVLGRTTGAGPVAMRAAMDSPSPDLVSAMRGDVTEPEVLQNFKDAMQGVRDQRSADYQTKLAMLPGGQTLDIQPVRDALTDSLKKFGVGVSKNAQGGTELDFTRSTLRDPGAQNEVLSIANDVLGWGARPGDLTPAGVDILKRRVDDVYSPSSTARALTQSVKSAARDVLSSQVPGYADMTRGYAQASDFLDKLSDLSLDSSNPGTATRKIVTMLKQNNGYRQSLAEALSQYSPYDLPGQVAGLSLSKLGPQGLAGVIDTGVGMLGAIAHGYISPAAALSAAAASPRLMGELLVAMSKVTPTGARLSRAASVTAGAAAAGNTFAKPMTYQDLVAAGSQ